MKVALVYDRVNKWGGAERVLLALHELFPDAPLFTSVYNKKSAPWASEFNVRTSFLQSFPAASSSHEYYPLLMPFAFESFLFEGYDLVISVTSEAAKGIITSPKTAHICYCLTPTRYLWSGYSDYFRNPLFRFFSKPVVSYLKKWDKIAAKRPDAYIAISKEVSRRIKKYYGRESEVVYPPVDMTNSKSQILNSKQIQNTEYFLIVSRLVPYKCIDIAIEAFNKLGLSLKIIGVGSDENRLKRLAKSNIEFLGNLTDRALSGYYRGCKALVFPGLEDFGLTIIEAQNFGKPVIAFKGGGAIESMVEGKTGEFFFPNTAVALEDCVRSFLKKQYDPRDCFAQAKKFSKERFQKQFMSKVNEILEKL